MKIYYYSKTTKGFYVNEIHGKLIPVDCVKITEEEHTALMNAQAKGKIIQPDKNGKPIAVDRTNSSLTWEDIRIARNQKLADSDWITNSDSPLIQNKKQDWLTYRQSLRDITKTYQSPEAVIWPTKPS